MDEEAVITRIPGEIDLILLMNMCILTVLICFNYITILFFNHIYKLELIFIELELEI